MSFVFPASCFACLFFAILFLSKKKVGKPDLFLAIYFLFHSFSFAYSWIKSENQFMLWSVLGLSMLKTLAVFFYIKSYIFNKISEKDYWLVLPILLKYSLALFLISYYKVANITQLSEIKAVSHLFFYYSAIVVLIFLIFSIKIIYSSTNKGRNANWFKIIVSERLLMLMITSFLFIFPLDNTEIIDVIIYSMAFIFLNIIGVIGYRKGFINANSEPKLGELSNKNQSLSNLDENQIKLFETKISEYLKTHRPYLQGDISLSAFSKGAEIPINLLSKYLNSKLNISFSDFINEYRVENVIKLVNNPKYNSYTLLSIAFESGFNSKATFNRAFKKIKGKTPTEYFKK